MATQLHQWTLTPVGDVLSERKENPSPLDLASGQVRIVSKIAFKDGKLQFRDGRETENGMILVRTGDIVVSGINAAKGDIGIYGEENAEPAAATIHYGSYSPNRVRVDVQFLWWLLRSEVFREILDANLPGGIKTELKARRLLPIKIPLPPLDEQRRIVSRIEELAAKIEEARSLRKLSSASVERILNVAAANSFENPEWPRRTVESLVGRANLKNGISVKSDGTSEIFCV